MYVAPLPRRIGCAATQRFFVFALLIEIQECVIILGEIQGLRHVPINVLEISSITVQRPSSP